MVEGEEGDRLRRCKWKKLLGKSPLRCDGAVGRSGDSIWRTGAPASLKLVVGWNQWRPGRRTLASVQGLVFVSGPPSGLPGCVRYIAPDPINKTANSLAAGRLGGCGTWRARAPWMKQREEETRREIGGGGGFYPGYSD